MRHSNVGDRPWSARARFAPRRRRDVDADGCGPQTAREEHRTSGADEYQGPVAGKVLFLAANPATAPYLAIDEELRAVEQKIRMSDGRDNLPIAAGLAVRADDLLQLLNQHRPTIVHFSGHGSASGALTLVDARGVASPLPACALSALAQAMKRHVRVVVLNSCYSQVQAQVIRQHIEFVIGMRAAISDPAAIVFAGAFYRALGFGCGVRESFEQACAALVLDGSAEHGTPVLLVRGQAPAELSP